MSKIINQFLSFTLSSAFAGFVLITVLLDHQNTSDYNRSNHANKIGRSRSIGKTPLSINRKITSGTNLSRPFIHYAGPITVTNATFPVAGDTLKMAIDNSPNPGLAALTPPGGNQTWDLSGLQVEANQNIVFAPASTGIANAQVPGAELVTNHSPGTETYYNVTSNAFELQAYYGIAPYEILSNNVFDYSPPLPERNDTLNFFDIHANTSNILETFPISSVASSLASLLPMNSDSVRYRVSIQRVSAVDGWGSLIIPGGTYDVLREKRTEYRSTGIDVKVPILGWVDISNLMVNSSNHGIGTDTMTSYYFFNDIVKEPIAIVTLDNTQSVSSQVQFKYNAPQASCAITGAFSGNPSGCNDNGTPSDPNDDYFTQDVSFNFTSNPMTGDLQLAPGGDQIGSYSIPVSSIVGNSHTFTGVKFKADGTSSLAIGNFTNELTCIDSVFGPAVNACLSGMLCGKITDTMETLRATIVNQTDSDAVNKWYTFCAPSRADALFYADACPINSSLTDNPRSTQFLTLTGFNFSIPNGAEIKGITLSISRRDSSNQDLSTRDSVIMLVNSATGTPDDKKSPLGWSIVPSNTYTIVTYGGPNDLWNAGGATWTPSAINSPNFGVNIQITGTTNSLVASIDEVSITVRYTTFAPDNTPPVLTCPVGTIVTCSTLIPTADASQVIRDDDLATIYFYKDSIPLSDSSCINQKVIYRIYRGVDTCTNLSQCIQMITVRDTMAPTIMCPQDTVEVSCGSGFPAAYTSVDSFVNHGGSVADACCIDSARFSYADDTIINGGMLILNRTYKITDCCGLSDSCTQVFRMPPCLDLALKKEIDGPVPFGVSAGGLIPFKITVYNQRFIPADSIKVIDFLPTISSTVITAGWINNNNGTACITLSRSNGSLPSTGLLQGDSVILHFNVQLGPDVSQGVGSNTAEIYSAQDTALNHLGDIDSHPNSFPNDPGEDDVSTAQFLFCDNLSCIDHVNGSLDDHCEKCFVASDFLKGILLPEEYYTIELYDASGKKLAGNCVDRSWLGYTLTYKVISKAPCQVNTCWGSVTIEDKYPPNVGPIVDTLTCFEFAKLPGGTYKVADNCSDSATVTIVSETYTDYGCDSAQVQGLVVRQLVSKDVWGTQVNLTKKIYIRKVSIDSVTCPLNKLIECGTTYTKDKNGNPDPGYSGAPTVTIKGTPVSLWPNSPSCKLEVFYNDERQSACGTAYKILRTWTITDWCSTPRGKDTICKQWIEIIDRTAPVTKDTILPVYYSSPHDCGQFVDLPLLKYTDCNTVTQTYILKYQEEGIQKVLSGSLPVKHQWLPNGVFKVDVTMTDACYNTSYSKISITIKDNTPPTPVCDEFTQLTVDPAGCWSSIAASDLDNGSRDNCSSKLHFAAAHMDSVDYWMKYWTSTLEQKCGKEAYWNNKELYESWIEDWIDCYVFRDTVHFDECGTNRVILRVYEADRIPRLDTHIFPWSEHAWYCYNSNIVYRIAHNYNFFDTNGTGSKSWRLPLDCNNDLELWLSNQKSKYISTRYGNNTDLLPDTNNEPMVTIQSHNTYCPVDTTINLNPGECNRIVKFDLNLPAGYTAVQTAGLPSGSEFPIGTVVNAFNIFNGNVLDTNCSFTVKIIEFDLFPQPIQPIETIQSHNTYCPVDTTINLDPGECGRIVKFTMNLPAGYTAVQTAGLPSGSEFPIGTVVNAFNIFNGNVLVTNCSFTVKIIEFTMASHDLNCKETTTVILNNNFAVLGAGQALVGGPYRCFDNYIVEVLRANTYTPAVFDGQSLGQTLTYRITDPGTSKRCQGVVTISSLPIHCKENVTLLLNTSGFAFLGADQVLIDATYRCFDNYIVEFLKPNATPGVAGIQDLCKTYKYRVTDPVSLGRCEGKVFIDDVNNSIEPLNFLDSRRKSKILYNDCMVNVLVDDKQAPTVDHLEDVTVFCDGAPDWADYPTCDDMYPPYPGELRDSKGMVHGYYGGSSQYDVHMGTGDHNDPQACDQNRGWAPIYCKNWLHLDSFDRGGQVNLSDYFEKPVLVDKKRPLDHTLKANEFTFTDNCRLDDASLTVTNNGTINGCGEGWISRTWTIKDKCGNAVSATQKIIVKHRSDFEVIFPADKKVTCDFLNRTDTSELGAGKPKLSDDDCEQLGVTYKDEIFTIVDSACYKIVRTWTIIDWCIYNPNQQKRYPDVIVNDSLRANTADRACVYRSLKDNNDGYMQYVQLIKVIDELKPHITNCSDQTVCIDKDCAIAVNIPLSGTDNCSDQIRFRADITRPDGTHDKRSDITAITGSNFTAGIYKIQVIAKDQCGNEDTCNFTLTIKDCKKPTPYCLNGIATVVMPSTGSVQVWAKDFDKGASDNCTEASKLKFSFTKNTVDASKIFTCTNIPNGKEQPINVEVWVTDEAGNQDFCSTYILLQDNGDATNPGGVCKDTAALVATLTGKLLTEEQEGVEFANVDVKGMQGVPSIVTSTDGSYSFSSIPMNTDHVSIKALRDDNPMNGVSTLDLVLIQKHILGTESLKSPYKMIAADVDNSNDISAIDLLELRKLILGIYDKLPNNTSWKFIPKSYTFSDASNPWNYPTEDVLTDMSEKMIRDFVGVKVGDVNSTAAAHNLMGTEIRSGETGLIFEVQDQVFKAGDKVSVAFRSPNFKGVSGFQGTMNFTIDKLQFDNLNRQSSIVQSSITSGSLKMTDNNIGRRWEHKGMITMSWNTNTSMDLKDDAVLFKMHFTAQSAGRLSDVLRIGSQHTIAESYEGKGELGNLSIRFADKDGKEVAGKSELYQNYPNPFDQRTVIGLNLAEAGHGILKITDMTGRTIKVIEQNWSRGYHEVWLDRRDIQASGVLYYNFESKTFRAAKKMVIVE